MASISADRVLDFSFGDAHLSVRHQQLVVRREANPEVTTPLADIAVVVLASRRVTLTQSVLSGLMDAGAAVIVCDESMLPSGLMLPLSAHTMQTRRMIAQARATLPRRKRIWQQIVRAKVLAQAAALEVRVSTDGGLRELAARIRSGDPENIESQAAQRYWPLLFNDPDFLRRRGAPNQNRHLNYGYAVFRATVGRALCAAGLHPSLGVHHRSRSNPYCLADDLIEPWRPLVDAEVAEIVGEHGIDAPLDPHAKQRLVGLLHERLDHEGESRTTVEWINRSASSLAACLTEREPLTSMRVFFPDGLLR
jgi:CRISPR-associated protein Cas1